MWMHVILIVVQIYERLENYDYITELQQILKTSNIMKPLLVVYINHVLQV